MKVTLLVRPTVSVAVTVALVDPAAIGVPVTTPVCASMANPAGRPEADHVYGLAPPVAPTVRETVPPVTAC
nr:hypothetical protein [Actinoplanes octamycinicus]